VMGATTRSGFFNALPTVENTPDKKAKRAKD
jgi:hypothetical protein